MTTEIDSLNAPEDTFDEEIRRLAEEVEAKLEAIAALGTRTGESSCATSLPVDVLRRRLLTRLSRTERRAAAERRSLRARKYVEQRGRCPLCGEQLELGRGRDVLPVEAHKPLACLACVRAQHGRRPGADA